MTVGKNAVSKDLLESLLADYRKPEDLIGKNGLLKQLTKQLIEKGLEPRWPTTSATARMSQWRTLPATPATGRARRD